MVKFCHCYLVLNMIIHQSNNRSNISVAMATFENFYLVFVNRNREMIFKIFSSKYYPSNENTKTRSELIPLITQPLSLDNDEQCASIPIINNEEISSNEEDKHE